MKQKHLIIVSYDGVFSYYTGVGTVIRNTIDILYEMDCLEDFKVSIAGISLDRSGKTFDYSSYDKAKSLSKKFGGHLISLANDTDGYNENDLWKDPANWRTACNSLVTALNIILGEEDDNIIFLHDTVFLYFEIAKRQIKANLRNTIRAFYVPHSSGLNHTFTNDSWNKERIKYERECFRAISNNPSSKIVAIGKNFSKHLKDCYGISFEKRDYLANGLIFDKYNDIIGKRSSHVDVKKYASELLENSKVIFSWGRLSQAKGFYELLNAWDKIQDKCPNHFLVIQAPMSCISEKAFFEQFIERKKCIPRVVHICDFNPCIWQTFLRYDKTDVVCFASPMDPNPFTPIEAKLFGKDMNYVIVASMKDGIKDSFSDEECIPVMDPSDSDNFADKLMEATNIKPEDRRAMSELNYQSAYNFDYRKNVMDFMKTNNII